MDLEAEFENLLKEEGLINNIINSLKELQKYPRYEEILKNNLSLTESLLKRKEQLKLEIEELTNEFISIAEVCSIEDAMDNNLPEYYF